MGIFKNFIKSQNTENHYVYKIGFIKVKLKKNRNNRILILKNGEWKEVKKLKNVKVDFLGTNSTLKIETPEAISCLNIPMFYSDSTITIKKTKYYIKDLVLRVGFNSEIFIDENFSCIQTSICSAREENTVIHIGKDCMFSSGIEIRSCDGHTIYDKNTKEILNKPQDIIIGNHVWLGFGTKVLKGGRVPNNCIVGISTIVTKKFDEENCILAGAPAKVVRKNVNWDRKSIRNYLLGKF